MFKVHYTSMVMLISAYKIPVLSPIALSIFYGKMVNLNPGTRIVEEVSAAL
jgi:acetylglutamate kinase